MLIVNLPKFHFESFKIKKRLPIDAASYKCDNAVSAMVDKDAAIVKIVNDLGNLMWIFYNKDYFDEYFEKY